MASVKSTAKDRRVVVGVDTHDEVHVAVVLDELGTRLGEHASCASAAGLAELETWASSFGVVIGWGVEGTGSYGAGLARYLQRRGARVVEVNRPDRQTRRALGGKTDSIDAEAAARAVLSGNATAIPKSGDGWVEVLRHLRMTRSSAVKAQTVAMNQLKAIVVTAPPELRDQLHGLTTARLIAACLALPTLDDLTVADTVASSLRALAHRWISLRDEAKAHHEQLARLIGKHTPKLLAEHGVGPDTAAALLIAVGDNPERMRSEATFAALCGTNPIPASSGKTNRHRLNRGGNRQANAALYRIVLVRLAWHEETRDYMRRHRAPNGSNNMHVVRCLKRYLARRLYPLLLEAGTSQPVLTG